MGNTFSRNLRIARINAGFTQEYVASHIGVATSTYSLYENGRREPNIDKIKMLADLLGVDKATLMKQIAELAPVKPSEPPQAVLQLQGLNISEIYETLTKTERRAFWRGIIKEIRFDKNRNFFIDWR